MFFAAQSSADCITNMSGFDLRQAQAPSRVPGHARLRHDGGDPPSRQPAAAQKNETPDHGKKQSTATPSLIRWSIQEIRRIAIRLARKRIKPAHIIAWSFWRRTHQAAAQRAHLKKRQL
jgi:hypothetical protein